jgi:hypothetical protein
LHRLSASFVLGYHGCDHDVAEDLLSGTPFKPSDNAYDWLGGGIYFWEVNPKRGLEFVTEMMNRGVKKITRPAVVGAVIDLGNCLDLMTSVGIGIVATSYGSLSQITSAAGKPMPVNQDRVRRQLDCAVIEHVHAIMESSTDIDTVRGVFVEGKPIYPGAGFDAKTHIQIAVRDPACIKGVFRVPAAHLNA